MVIRMRRQCINNNLVVNIDVIFVQTIKPKEIQPSGRKCLSLESTVFWYTWYIRTYYGFTNKMTRGQFDHYIG